MTKALFDISGLESALKQGELILTPNRRMTAKIQAAYAAQQTAAHHQAWPTPRVMAIEHWLQSLWQRLADSNFQPAADHIVLSELREQLLWEQIIQQHSGDHLVKTASAAQTAKKAFDLLLLWQLDWRESALATTHDSECFQQWLKQFLATCQVKHYLTKTHTAHFILKACERSWLTQYPHIHLVGFDNLSPLHQAIIEGLAEQAHHYRPRVDQPYCQRTELNNFADELQAAANWAHGVLANNAEAMIGIIVPDLHLHRQQVETTFQQVFEPQVNLPECPRYTLPFNFSAGQPLSQQPIIATALAMIELNKPELEVEQLCQWLTSPFYHLDALPLDFSALLSEQIIRSQQLMISPSRLRQMSQQLFDKQQQELSTDLQQDLFNQASCPFTQALQSIEQLKIKAQAGYQNRRHYPSHWIKLFYQQWQCLGWPGERRLDSVEYQQVTRFYEEIKAFAGLDEIVGQIPLIEASRLLYKQLQQVTFQAQTKDSPIQILGSLEGAGLRFSHCWLMGFDDSTWPAIPKPNPFIPIDIQVANMMPHASVERELAFTKEIIDTYKHNAEQIIFSYARMSGDKEQHLCPLLDDLPTVEASPWLASQTQISSATVALETYSTQQSQPVNAETTTIKGGSQILKSQANCPFQAFAKHRLEVSALPLPLIGLPAWARGQCLHHGLEVIWRELKNHDTLINTSDDALQALIQRATTHGLKRLLPQFPNVLSIRYQQLEQLRLKQWLTAWLGIEKERPPFQVVAIEQGKRCTIAGLPLSLRVDRIDQLADGSYLLIDYKMTPATDAAWASERLDDPQLPLYCTVANSHIGAICFANLSPKGRGFRGLSETDTGIPQIIPIEKNKRELPNEWEATLAQWQQQLGQLATAFLEGDSRIDPKSTQSCRYCDLASLCRINHQGGRYE
ncbi:PD-(D/E)XK nuclease family protein [Spartinivicinus poritis]|uniref:PD-(D/E)XK nuclease family protein n=1 Tax=Spartinivicinus poritis TaxID=2994640 RepID=A0ABT5U313_9GAMM|nr:PD-(D/E)XK nuclease family protein [Spartinivicinus sp. A2-2]MDE1460762.1 PD-(D/E)XK nuclease family protein [Spartinivicinus sp. A2-2]